MSLTTNLIERLRAYASIRKGELAELITEAADTIELLSAKLHASQMERSSQYYHGGWIPCSERLPEQYGNYLVSYRTDDFESDISYRTDDFESDISYRTDDFESDIGTFDPDRINSDTGEWSACDANGFYWVASKGLEVVAWMPLPEAYKEGE